VSVVAFASGFVIVALTVIGVIYVLILPRAPTGIGRMSLLVIRVVHMAFRGMSRFSRTYEAKDAFLAPVAPVALVAQLLSWAGGLTVGYALMLVPTTHSFWLGFTQSLTSLFTVGAIHSGGRANVAIDITAGSTWVVIVALQIAYLPSLYSKFAHREGLITLLETRAGSPTWGPELLIRHHFAGITDSIGGLYEEWERWAAEVSESHTTYPILLYFRSPDPWLSWVVALLTVLDAAAIQMAVAPKTAPTNARMLLHTGFTTFQRLALSMGWEIEENPDPDTPIELTFEEFAHAVNLLTRFGPTPERSAEEAWPDFCGWRVNYEHSAYRLADYFTAPPAQWSGNRRHVSVEDIKLHMPPHQLLDREAGGLTPGAHGLVSEGRDQNRGLH
jgi:hypothetical protein